MRFYRAFRDFFLLLLLITAFLRAEAQGTPPDSTGAPVVKDQPKGLLDSKVQYKAKDSTSFDLPNQKVYLYGKGDVTYQSINLKAAYIELDLKNKTVHAKTGVDSLGKPAGRPVFTESDKSFEAEEMWYNFETKKGRINDVRTHEGDSYIHSNTALKDSSDVYYIRSGEYTTCNLEHPHYAIHAGKLKVIPNDKIITGPAYIEVADVPTPLAIPFGFFPNKKGQASGIIPPRYGESNLLGFYLKDGGYYFGFNDTLDLALKGSIYSYGSWAAETESNYKVRYKYNGKVTLSYAHTLFDDPELPNSEPQKDIFIKWSHTQDPKRNPNSRFSANVNAGSSSYNRLYTTNSYTYLNNQLQSNIAYTRTMDWRVMSPSLSVNARHSQNTVTRSLILDAPELTFSVPRIYPSRLLSSGSPARGGFGKALDKIGISMVSNASNHIDTKDSILFDLKKYDLSLDDVSRYGVRHSIPLSASFPVFKYFNTTLSATWASSFFFKAKELTFNGTNVDTLISNKFSATSEYSAAATFLWKWTGLANFGKRTFLGMTAIRHVITPSISFSYRPDYSRNNRYYKTVQIDAAGTTQQYSVFEGGLYSAPPTGKSGLVSWNLNNNVEAKVRKTTDTAGTVINKITLIESFLISGAYNMAVEHFNWSPINVSGRTKLFKKVDVVASSTFNPYALDVNGTGNPIERFEWNVNKKLARITAANLAIGTSLQSKKRDEKPKESTKGSPQEMEFIRNNPEAFVDFNVPWTLGMDYTLVYSKPGINSSITQGLGMRGDFSLTPNWKIGFYSNYDLETGDFGRTSVNVYRDLHCWEMVFNWVPFGPGQGYTLDIRVKAPVLQDLKLSRRRDWYDYR